MPKEKQYAVLKLSEEAQGIVHKMLDRRRKATEIAKAVAKRTGEKIPWQSIAPYATRYASRQQPREIARRRTDALIGRAHNQGCEIPAMLRAAFLEAFTEASRNGSLHEMNLMQLETAERKRRELALRKKQVSLAERRVKVFEERWKLDRNKAQAAIAQLDQKARKGESLSAEDVNQIREIYGLYESSEREWRNEEEQLQALESDNIDDNADQNIDQDSANNIVAAR